MITVDAEDAIHVGCGEIFPYDVSVMSTSRARVTVRVTIAGAACRFRNGGRSVELTREVPAGQSSFHFVLAVVCDRKGSIQAELIVEAYADDDSPHQDVTWLSLACQ